MINKKTNNTGLSGGHGMQILDLSNMSYSDISSEVKSGLTAYCPCCGTDFRLDEEKYAPADQANLIGHFRRNGCVECEATTWKRVYAAGYHKVFVKVAVEIGGRSIEAIRIPNGFRTSKLKALVDLEKPADEDAPKQEYTTINGRQVPITRYDECGGKVE